MFSLLDSESTVVLQLLLSFLMRPYPWILCVCLALDVGLTKITLSPSLIGLQTIQPQTVQTEVKEQSNHWLRSILVILL